MGKPTGSYSQQNVSLLTPEQQSLFSSVLGNVGPAYQQALGGFLQPQSVEDYQALFQQSFIDPAMQQLRQQIVPGIKQQFGDIGASSSSALNQALAQAAEQATTNIGSNIGNFMLGQQANQLQALGQFSPFLTAQTFQPMFQKKQGWLGPVLSATGAIAGGAIGGPAGASAGANVGSSLGGIGGTSIS